MQLVNFWFNLVPKSKSVPNLVKLDTAANSKWLDKMARVEFPSIATSQLFCTNLVPKICVWYFHKIWHSIIHHTKPNGDVVKTSSSSNNWLWHLTQWLYTYFCNVEHQLWNCETKVCFCKQKKEWKFAFEEKCEKLQRHVYEDVTFVLWINDHFSYGDLLFYW